MHRKWHFACTALLAERRTSFFHRAKWRDYFDCSFYWCHRHCVSSYGRKRTGYRCFTGSGRNRCTRRHLHSEPPGVYSFTSGSTDERYWNQRGDFAGRKDTWHDPFHHTSANDFIFYVWHRIFTGDDCYPVPHGTQPRKDFTKVYGGNWSYMGEKGDYNAGGSKGWIFCFFRSLSCRKQSTWLKSLPCSGRTWNHWYMEWLRLLGWNYWAGM